MIASSGHWTYVGLASLDIEHMTYHGRERYYKPLTTYVVKFIVTKYL